MGILLRRQGLSALPQKELHKICRSAVDLFTEKSRLEKDLLPGLTV
ncbi:MAG: hypothetical protein V2I65_06675 [Paracoccaceae bacterium]|jgi:hypothetical protein|nr:hypothetical protein [Paracoccaceae bacterium]